MSLSQVKGRHLWTIDDFMRRAASTEVGDSLCSPVFAVAVEGFDGETQNLTFQLEVSVLLTLLKKNIVTVS